MGVYQTIKDIYINPTESQIEILNKWKIFKIVSTLLTMSVLFMVSVTLVLCDLKEFYKYLSLKFVIFFGFCDMCLLHSIFIQSILSVWINLQILWFCCICSNKNHRQISVPCHLERGCGGRQGWGGGSHCKQNNSQSSTYLFLHIININKGGQRFLFLWGWGEVVGSW